MNHENNPAHISDKIPAWKSPWFWAVVGLVIIVLAVNCIMVLFAVRSNPGLVSKDYYERGKSFTSRTNVDFLRQNKTGWKITLSEPEKIHTGTPSLFQVTVTGKEGEPLIADSATLFVYRPSDAASDFSVPMAYKGDGVYSAEISFLLTGAWDVIAEIQKEETRGNLAKSLMVEKAS